MFGHLRTTIASYGKRFDFIKNRIVSITVGISLIAILVGLGVLSTVRHRLAQSTAQSYETQQEILANQLADTLAVNLHSIEQSLHIASIIPEINDYSHPNCSAKLDEVLTLSKSQLGNLGRVTPDGQFVCSVNRAIIGEPVKKYGDYVANLIHDPQHHPVLSRGLFTSGSSSLAVGLHVPVYTNGGFNGTLGGAIYFERFQDQYLSSVKIARNGFVVLLDDNGDILYHPERGLQGKSIFSPQITARHAPTESMRQLIASAKTQESGHFRYRLNNQQKTGVYQTVPVQGRKWIVLVTIPTEDITAVINDAEIPKIFGTLILLLAISISFVTFIGLRNIMKSLEVQQLKDDFISLTSHQLRTPATAVKQYLGLIMDGYASSAAEQKKLIAYAHENNEEQLRIIASILSAAKVAAGKLEITKEPFVLQHLIERLCRTTDLSLRAKKLTLHTKLIKKPVQINADETKLAMAIENLLSNAIKYTEPGGTITISLQTRAGNAVLSIADTGQGIDKKDIPKLFKRFARVEHKDIKVNGTGLGLYLSHEIITLHGGTIHVQSEPDKGSTFTIRLPYSS